MHDAFVLIESFAEFEDNELKSYLENPFSYMFNTRDSQLQ